ncbi:MAG: hypothetical protein Ct9H300mP27_03670 [Chloroflexota bacterium]|nr:MAG: hypothetical protein Ct9H300mP27_03670 [Chloroflexota bacterium]
MLVHEATAFAATQNKFLEFYQAISKEYWDHGADIGSLYLIRKATVESGLTWESMWETLSRSSFRSWVVEQHTWRSVKVSKPSLPIFGETNLWQGDFNLLDLESTIKETLALPNRKPTTGAPMFSLKRNNRGQPVKENGIDQDLPRFITLAKAPTLE